MKPPSLFQSLPESAVAALLVMKLEPPTRAFIDRNEQAQKVESRLNPETMLSSLMNRSYASFATGSLWFRVCRRMKITVLRTSG